MKKIKTINLLLVMSLLVMTIFPSHVAFAESPSELNGEEKVLAEELAEDFEFIFEEATIIEDDHYKLDEEKVEEKFGEEAVPSIKALVKVANGEELTPHDLIGIEPVNQSNGDLTVMSGWTDCMKDAVLDATGIAFLTGGMATLIEQKKWQELGKEIIKVAGKNALKGGVVGFAASMAWYSVRCNF
ncbi:hypothetical protein [Alkalibacillus haloalkaliphilus]|uniref:hypothetical protein n=1 Tax=Alkalibacillus haloalkaliphilus TaxID=94136 RepID=UPI0002E96BEB|nr:hypothetical protein [Alkalibacillus haloalkaliphilus]